MNGYWCNAGSWSHFGWKKGDQSSYSAADGWWTMWSVSQINEKLHKKTGLWMLDLNMSSGQKYAVSGHCAHLQLANQPNFFFFFLLPKRWLQPPGLWEPWRCWAWPSAVLRSSRGAVFSVCTSCGSYFLSASSLMANTKKGWGGGLLDGADFSPFFATIGCFCYVELNGEGAVSLED